MPFNSEEVIIYYINMLHGDISFLMSGKCNKNVVCKFIADNFVIRSALSGCWRGHPLEYC